MSMSIQEKDSNLKKKPIKTMHSGCHKKAESWRSDTWKCAKVTPILKSGSKHVSIFRHVSEISIFYKILSWIVNHQLRNFVLAYSAIRIIHLLCKASKGGSLICYEAFQKKERGRGAYIVPLR